MVFSLFLCFHHVLQLAFSSLIPFVIRWIGEARVTAGPVAAYGIVLMMAALAYWVLERVIILVDVAEEGEAPLELAVGSVLRERWSIAMYLIGASLAFVEPWIAVGIYILVALLWFAPDRRVEKEVEKAVEAGSDDSAGP